MNDQSAGAEVLLFLSPFQNVFSCQFTPKFWFWILLSWIWSPNTLLSWLTCAYYLLIAEAVICRSGEQGRGRVRWWTTVLNYDLVDLRHSSPWHFNLELCVHLDGLKLGFIVQWSSEKTFVDFQGLKTGFRSGRVRKALALTERDFRLRNTWVSLSLATVFELKLRSRKKYF